jgi:hypothetical protein
MNGSKRFIELKKRIEITTTAPVGRRAKIHIGKFKHTGVGVAVVVRGSDQVYRAKIPSMTEARRLGVLCWMLDGSLIPELKNTHGVDYILTLERESGDLWVSKTADWLDEDKLYKSDDPTAMRTDRMGYALRHLPVQHMLHVPGNIPILPRAR